MLCTRCQKNTARYAVKYKGESKPTAHLCAECYIAVKQKLAEQKVEERACPACGATMSEYLRTGLLGCPECYAFFETELQPYILRLQTSGEHRGSRPLNPLKYELATQIRELISRQADAELVGNMELARRVNNKVEELKYALFVDGGEDEGV